MVNDEKIEKIMQEIDKRYGMNPGIFDDAFLENDMNYRVYVATSLTKLDNNIREIKNTLRTHKKYFYILFVAVVLLLLNSPDVLTKLLQFFRLT